MRICARAYRARAAAVIILALIKSRHVLALDGDRHKRCIARLNVRCSGVNVD